MRTAAGVLDPIDTSMEEDGKEGWGSGWWSPGAGAAESLSSKGLLGDKLPRCISMEIAVFDQSEEAAEDHIAAFMGGGHKVSQVRRCAESMTFVSFY